MSVQQSFAARLPFFYGWVVIGVAFVTMGIGVNARTAFSLLYPPILEEFGWGYGGTAAIFSIGFFVSTVATPVIGILMGRYGPRVIIPIGALMVAAGLVLATWASALWQFYLTLGFLVIGGSIFISYIGHSMFLANWFQRKRGFAVGVAFSGVGVGGIVLFLWIQSIISSLGWRVSCWAIAGLLVAIVVPLNLIFQRQRPEDLGLMPDGGAVTGKTDASVSHVNTIIDKEWVQTEWTVRRALGTSRFWWLALTLGTGLFVWYTVQVHQSQYLEQLGFGKEQVALALGVVVISGIVGQIFLGHLSDRIGRELVWTISLSGYVLCYVILLVMASQPSTLLMYAMAAAQGALGYGLASLYGSMPADLFQGPRFAAILGVASIAANLGAGIGPWVAGVIFDYSESYDMAWWLAIAVSLASIAAVWMAAPRKVRCVPGQASG
ncbi:MAG: MFS transporter [Rickettsiales bacterium]|jgi:MFS family permease|nr:MFS transporter [Rickettsiales bacterium]|tara:strand:+ start:3128 stop:4438 length:1311 start_codon:yes stop_codon:yes gene_type:complete